jgi:ankyrin repeat protein
MLLDAGADVHAHNNKYSNALQEAALLGKEEVVKMLLGAGADVNVQGSKYSNATQAAA